MAIITEIISKQNFEIVGEKIGDILSIELSNQKTLQNSLVNFAVFKERVTAIDKTEEVVVNVLLNSIDNSSSSQSGAQSVCSFFIDVFASAKETEANRGDKAAFDKLLKYVGMCRYILQSHKYKTLSFDLGLYRCTLKSLSEPISKLSKDLFFVHK